MAENNITSNQFHSLLLQSIPDDNVKLPTYAAIKTVNGQVTTPIPPSGAVLQINSRSPSSEDTTTSFVGDSITVTKQGVYRASLSVSFVAINDSTTFFFTVQKNTQNTELVASVFTPSALNAVHNVSAHTLFTLDENDTLRVYMTHNHSSSRTVRVTDAFLIVELVQ